MYAWLWECLTKFWWLFRLLEHVGQFKPVAYLALFHWIGIFHLAIVWYNAYLLAYRISSNTFFGHSALSWMYTCPCGPIIRCATDLCRDGLVLCNKMTKCIEVDQVSLGEINYPFKLRWAGYFECVAILKKLSTCKIIAKLWVIAPSSSPSSPLFSNLLDGTIFKATWPSSAPN